MIRRPGSSRFGAQPAAVDPAPESVDTDARQGSRLPDPVGMHMG
ncbi:hypothetical protein ACWD7C_33545 [Streptomyces sp. NPDC005134]